MGGNLLRYNYSHEYLACEGEGISERQILVEMGLRTTVWKALNYFVEIAQLQLNGT